MQVSCGQSHAISALVAAVGDGTPYVKYGALPSVVCPSLPNFSFCNCPSIGWRTKSIAAIPRPKSRGSLNQPGTGAELTIQMRPSSLDSGNKIDTDSTWDSAAIRQAMQEAGIACDGNYRRPHRKPARGATGAAAPRHARPAAWSRRPKLASDPSCAARAGRPRRAASRGSRGPSALFAFVRRPHLARRERRLPCGWIQYLPGNLARLGRPESARARGHRLDPAVGRLSGNRGRALHIRRVGGDPRCVGCGPGAGGRSGSSCNLPE